jgi:4-hydroxy-tetrahydrodipicolinate reductase
LIRVGMHGAAGRMGRSIIGLLANDTDARLTAAVDHAGSPAIGHDAGLLAGPTKLDIVVTSDLRAALANVDVVIDFSLPSATAAVANACVDAGVALVVGTTGLDVDGRNAIDVLAKRCPVVVAPNYSIGVNVLWHLASRAVALLGPDFDIEIVEMHHRNKVDAPSGTALRLAQAVADARGVDTEKVSVHGRSGQVGARTADEVGVMSLRGGDVVGDHTLVLAGPGERVEITHRAHTREIFARGAITAAKWVVGRRPGLYDMADVLAILR